MTDRARAARGFRETLERIGAEQERKWEPLLEAVGRIRGPFEPIRDSMEQVAERVAESAPGWWLDADAESVEPFPRASTSPAAASGVGPATGERTGGDGKPEKPPVATSASGRVRLYGSNDPPVIDGIEQKRLTPKRYLVVEALLRAGANGLTKDALSRNSGVTDARGILTRMRNESGDWGKIIRMAVVTGGGYRIE